LPLIANAAGNFLVSALYTLYKYMTSLKSH